MLTNNPTYKTIKFTPSYQDEEIELELEFNRYGDGQRYLGLWYNDEPYLTATVRINVPGHPTFELDEDDVVIKNYSENEGVLEALIAANIIDKPHTKLPCNFVTLYVCQLK
jgi:hypothetical protein